MGCSASTVEPDASFHELYKLGRKLGEGAFGQVRVARSRKDEEVELAVKIVDARCFGADSTKVADEERIAMTRQEIKVWQAVGSHQHCVAFWGSHFERNLFYMVMEQCSRSLMDELSSTALVEGDLCGIFAEMLAGIAHVHSRNIVHRDIKPDNFLLGGETGTTIKLCDFGFASRLPKKGFLKGVYGTAPYMSPEMLANSGTYDRKTDVWSMGATAYLMIHSDFPYMPVHPNAIAMKQAIKHGVPGIRFVRNSVNEGPFSREFVDCATPFLQALLQRNTPTRKTAEEALQLPFVLNETNKEEAPAFAFPSEEVLVLAPVAMKARRVSRQERELSLGATRHEFEQKGLEDVLGLLQEKHGTSEVTASTTYFSEGDGVIVDRQKSRKMDEQKTEDRIINRGTRRRCTHSGVTGKQAGVRISPTTMRALDLTV